MAYFRGMQEHFAVIALGGNAILRKGQTADPETQAKNLRRAVAKLVPALNIYSSFALTHGNGPQVGNDLTRSYAGRKLKGIPELSLADCVANTQGRIGHWILRELRNNPDFKTVPSACVLTHVYVEKNSFRKDEYTKGVGPWLPNTEGVRKDLESRGAVYSVSADRKELRMTVPSPRPVDIDEFRIISSLLRAGVITVCCGGGGIPLYNRDIAQGKSPVRGKTVQSNVVVDKDLASALLAVKLLEEYEGAEIDLIILMEQRGLFRDARCRSRDFIQEMTLAELDEFLESNELDRGSILPKLEAVKLFLEAGGKNAYLGPLDGFEEIFQPGSRVGTHFTQLPQLHLYN